MVRRPRLRHAHRRRDNEGEGDLLVVGDLVLAGTGFRTDRAAHAELQELFGRPVISLDLVGPHYYHLDTALAVLSSDPADPQIAYYPPAFSAGSRAVLQQLFPDAVEATERDAVALGLNAVSDGYNVVVAPGAVDLAEATARARLQPDPRRHQRAAQGRRRRQVLHARDPRPATGSRRDDPSAVVAADVASSRTTTTRCPSRSSTG